MERPRLLAQLARRWDSRLVTVVAGPGFGKTVLLATAIAHRGCSDDACDVWLSCAPADEQADHLTAGVTEALGLSRGTGLDAILEHVWSRAPMEVCFVFDDVHEIPADSSGAAVLGRLVVDLPANGHVVLASRDAVPVSTARLATAGQLVRVSERDLVLDDAELDAFAGARGIDPVLLKSTGGWPALAELTASAGADLVIDYLWEELLGRIGVERAQLLARLSIVGGGDDEVTSAMAERAVRVDDVLAGVPLVARAADGWAVLHPLWRPALQPLLTADEATEARRRAAAVHRARGRVSAAVDLFAEAEDWDGVLVVLRDAEMLLVPPVGADELGRWVRLLPSRLRQEPEVLLAAGLARQERAPLEALPIFEAVAAGFRAKGDADGEMTAIGQNGLVRWWIKDFPGILALQKRAQELAAAGSAKAAVLLAVSEAGIGHLTGDSARTLAALSDVDEGAAARWLPIIHWHRSASHRRSGDLGQARAELDAARDLPLGRFAPELEMAELHVAWLEGDVDHVLTSLSDLRAQHERFGDDFLMRETLLELSCKTAWLGELDTAKTCLALADGFVAGTAASLTRVLRVIASGAIAVAEGDEPGAAALIEEEVMAALAGTDSWYWRDRGVVALAHVLLPSTRSAWTERPLAAPHRPGVALAEALEAARAGDLSVVGSLAWPEVGIVRTQLPSSWIAELAAAGVKAGNPPPRDLVDVPLGHLELDVIGPLGLRRDGEAVTHPDFRRQRVRELLSYLVVHKRARREEVAAELWPELDDGGRNLRTTLSYLQRVLEPDRTGREPPYFVRTDGSWLALVAGERLTVDAWQLDAALDDADAAERAGAPKNALAAYRVARSLWCGEPFVDAPYAPWAVAERTRLCTRYAAAAVRGGELELAAGDAGGARRFAESAVSAEPYSELAYDLLARTHLAEGDRAGARRALDSSRHALEALNLNA